MPTYFSNTTRNGGASPQQQNQPLLRSKGGGGGSPRQRHNKRTSQCWWWKLLTASFVVLCVVTFLLFDSWLRLDASTLLLSSSSTASLLATIHQDDAESSLPTIAIATSLTSCPDVEVHRTVLLDTAAVLRHSIDVMAKQSKYQYDCLVFVHPAAVNCTTTLQKAGFQVLVRDTPVDVTQIQNTAYRDRMVKSGCCGEREFLKLYAYTLDEYPVVLHVDMDMILLKPYDHIIDAFLAPDDAVKVIPDAMAPADRQRRQRMGIAFTRDYSTGQPGRPAHEYNVQGGFLMVRPNQTAFEELRQIILQGHFSHGWYDGNVKYPFYYGGETIQGIISFYYGHYHADQFVELDRCVHNAMAEPQTPKNDDTCYSITNFTTGECHYDCQLVNVSDVYSIHYTNCGKSYRCFPQNHFQWNKRAVAKSRLCLDFHEEWFRLRDSLDVHLGISSAPHAVGDDRTFGHCDFGFEKELDRYRPINWTMAQRNIGT